MNSLEPRPPVEVTVEGQNRSNPVAFHDGNMNGVAGRELDGILSDLGRAQNVALFNRVNVIDDIQHCPKRRLDSVTFLNGRISTKNFLQHLGVCYQALTGSNQTLEEDLGIGFVRMRCSDKVHRYIRVDKDQAS